MRNENLKCIYIPKKNDDWVIIITEENVYTLRLGGFKLENDVNINNSNYKRIDFKNKGNTKITEIYTDEEWVYLVLANGQIIAHGWVNVNFFGEMELGVKIQDRSNYESDFFDNDDFDSIELGPDGWSKIKN